MADVGEASVKAIWCGGMIIACVRSPTAGSLERLQIIDDQESLQTPNEIFTLVGRGTWFSYTGLGCSDSQTMIVMTKLLHGTMTTQSLVTSAPTASSRSYTEVLNPETLNP